MKNIVLKRILSLGIISILCILVGIAFGIATGDKILIIMSSIICLVNLYKIWEFKQIEKNGKYIVLSGKCIDNVYNFAGKFRVCKLESEEEVYEISLPKSVKLKINQVYTFYFKEIEKDLLVKNKWLRNKMLSEKFLGYEAINND